MDKLEFTNRNLENLNRCIAENGKIELMKFTELTNRLFEAINYSRSCGSDSEQLKSKKCGMCDKKKEDDGHYCCEDCGGIAF